MSELIDVYNSKKEKTGKVVKRNRGASLEKGEYMARVLISMPEGFLEKIDQVADGENRSRSELIREALRTYIYKQKVRE